MALQAPLQRTTDHVAAVPSRLSLCSVASLRHVAFPQVIQDEASRADLSRCAFGLGLACVSLPLPGAHGMRRRRAAGEHPWRYRARRRVRCAAVSAAATLDPLEPLSSPFPLGDFEEQGLPATSRFLWWEESRAGRRPPGAMRSGLHALDLERGWLEVAEPDAYTAAMKQRRDILASQRGFALVDDVESRGAQAELLDLIVKHLARRHPDRFALRGLGESATFLSREEGLSWRIEDFAESPLLLAGQLLQEDLCIMRMEQPGDSVDPQHVFVAGVVTESFDPVAKHMLPMLQLHDPVPGYSADLHAKMNRAFANLRKPLWRANFSFYEWRWEGDEEELSAENLAERLYLKVEYETLQRLPAHSDYLVFTIRAHVDPLAALRATPRACAALAAELRRLRPELLEYKGLATASARAAVINFLEADMPPHIRMPA